MNLRRLLSTALWLLLATSASLLTGCQTPMTFATPAANWPTHMGQMHYTNAAGKSVVGDVVVRRSPEGRDFQLQFSSGPGFPLLKLSQSGDNARAEGLLARGSWQGRAGSAPVNLRNWFKLREVFAAGTSKTGQIQGAGWTGNAALPPQLSTSFSEAGERFAFHFSR